MKDLILRYKKTLILTSLIILLPLLAGLLLWDRLPDQLATSFDFKGVANDYSSKTFTVIGLPLFLLVMQWFCFFGCSLDPKRRNFSSSKLFSLILWIIPSITIFLEAGVYGVALGMELNIAKMMYPFLAVVFLLGGNYLPKCRPNYTMGLKLPWTLADEENWNKTHRLAGPIWMFCGIATLACTFLPAVAAMCVMLGAVLAATLVPTAYSILLAAKMGQL